MKLVLCEFPTNKSKLFLNKGETKLFPFTIIHTCEPVLSFSYELYVGTTLIDSGDITKDNGYYNLYLSNLNVGEYWLYTTYTTETQTRKDTWSVIVR